MEDFKALFEEIVKSNNPEEINDFLIKLSKYPNKLHLTFLQYFVNNLDDEILAKIKLNLINTLGEIGRLEQLDEVFLKFLSQAYYASDRWVRNEIIQAYRNTSRKSKLPDKTIELIGYAVNDDYLPIKINALKFILDLENLPEFVLKNIFRLLNTKNTEVNELCERIFDKFTMGTNKLFLWLNHAENYQLLKPHGIRSLLLIHFKSVINVEQFRKNILTSNWKDELKEIYLKEIDIYESILLKNV